MNEHEKMNKLIDLLSELTYIVKNHEIELGKLRSKVSELENRLTGLESNNMQSDIIAALAEKVLE